MTLSFQQQTHLGNASVKHDVKCVGLHGVGNIWKQKNFKRLWVWKSVANYTLQYCLPSGIMTLLLRSSAASFFSFKASALFILIVPVQVKQIKS